MSTTTKVYAMYKHDVYCERGVKGEIPLRPWIEGWLGNPVVIFHQCNECGKAHTDSEKCLPCYYQYLIRRLRESENWKEEFLKLYGKRLGTYTRHDVNHVDIIIEVLDWYAEKCKKALVPANMTEEDFNESIKLTHGLLKLYRKAKIT